MKQKLIIFDFDGVLVDTFDLFYHGSRKKLAELGYNLAQTKESFLDLFSANVYQEQLRRGVTETHIAEILSHLEGLARVAHIQLFDGVLEMLTELHDNYEMAIVSSNTTNLITKVLQEYDIEYFFHSILGGESSSTKEIRIHEIMAITKKEPNATSYIGDTVGDMREAKRAGVTAIGAAWGWHGRTKLTQAKADLIIDSPAEFAEVMLAETVLRRG